MTEHRAGETPYESAVQQILYMWEDTAIDARLTIPEKREAAETAIDALRNIGWARA